VLHLTLPLSLVDAALLPSLVPSAETPDVALAGDNGPDVDFDRTEAWNSLRASVVVRPDAATTTSVPVTEYVVPETVMAGPPAFNVCAPMVAIAEPVGTAVAVFGTADVTPLTTIESPEDKREYVVPPWTIDGPPGESVPPWARI
jgi:hypothetical protein